MADLWNQEELCSDLLDDVPAWVGNDIRCNDVAAIIQGGCASGAWMPAVTYCDAAQTMADDGDDVLEFIENALGELPQPNMGESWSGLACFYLSMAVELWASSVEDELLEALAAREEESE